jgi:unsaturated chondroitin disaccharide hydrolase
MGRPDLTYTRCGDGDWVDGFWSGQLWLAYAETGEALFFDAARAQRVYFADRLNRPASHDHDLGFLYSLSAVADYKLTRDEAARRMGLLAAESLATRFNPHGQFIRAWNDWAIDTPASRIRKRGKMIIDGMMNLGLLFWAAQESGRTRYADIAIAHATTSAHYLVRADGSSYHSFDFDPVSGRPLGGATVQGYADESCWSRGQAWGVHGFAQTYAYTGIPVFRETAQRLADYIIAHLPADCIPPWDYQLPTDAPHYRDSSAAAITAAGLFLLADVLADAPAQAAAYRTAANAMLRQLADAYSTAAHPQAEGLLLHGAGFVKKGHADTMLPYGDYFYVEALLRAQGRTAFFW